MTIKAIPEDFVVTEHLDGNWMRRLDKERGPFAVYQLHKRGLTTPDAVGLLARSLQVPYKDVLAAGLKDRHAVTSQYVTVRLSRRMRARGVPGRVRGRSGQASDWHAVLSGYAEEALHAGMIDRNHFELVVRGLTRKAAEAMDASAEQLKLQRKKGQAPTLLVSNYYGNQRFGGLRGGRDFLAKHLMQGDFLAALAEILTHAHRKDARELKQLRKTCAAHWGDWLHLSRVLPTSPMAAPVHHLATHPDDLAGAFAKLPYFEQHIAIEAYQSFLWNQTLTHYLRQRIERDALVEVKDRMGDMVFPVAEAAEAMSEDQMPVLGYRSRLSGDWQGAARQVLSEEGWASTEDFQIPGLDRPRFGEVPRRIFADVCQFRMRPVEHDERQPEHAARFKRHLRFTLPRGSYATVVLRALGQ